MKPSAAFTLELLDAELPAAPGTQFRVRVRGDGSAFFGADGLHLGKGYSFSVNGVLWRTILETVSRADDCDGGGTDLHLRVEGHYETGGTQDGLEWGAAAARRAAEDNASL